MMILDVDVRHRLLHLRRAVRLADGRPNDGRCGNVSAAVEAELGWRRECGYLRLLDGPTRYDEFDVDLSRQSQATVTSYLPS